MVQLLIFQRVRLTECPSNTLEWANRLLSMLLLPLLLGFYGWPLMLQSIAWGHFFAYLRFLLFYAQGCIYKCGMNVLWYLNQIWFESIFIYKYFHAFYVQFGAKQTNSTILHERLREFSDADFGAKIRSWMFRLGNRKYQYHLLFVVIRDGVSYVYYKSTMALHHVYLEIQSNSFSKTNWKSFQ